MNEHIDADQILSIAEVAARMHTTEERAARSIRSAGLTPVRTATGIGYVASDIDQLRSHKPHSHHRPGREEL